MNSSLASGLVSGSAADGPASTSACTFRLTAVLVLVVLALDPPQGDSAALDRDKAALDFGKAALDLGEAALDCRDFAAAPSAEDSSGGRPGPRRRNSEMMSWPAPTDSSSLRMVPMPVSSSMVAPEAFESTTRK